MDASEDDSKGLGSFGGLGRRDRRGKLLMNTVNLFPENDIMAGFKSFKQGERPINATCWMVHEHAPSINSFLKSPQDYLSRGLLVLLGKTNKQRLLKKNWLIWMLPSPIR